MSEQPAGPKKPRVYLPPEIAEPPISNPSVAAAFRALRDGTAAPYQQQLAMRWLMDSACLMQHFPYHLTDRDTAFALGRRFVGEHVLKFLAGPVQRDEE